MQAHLVFPHQLFTQTSSLDKNTLIVFVEPALFYTQYRFHLQKLVLHRAGLRTLEEALQKRGFQTLFCEIEKFATIDGVFAALKERGVQTASVFEVADDYLSRETEAGAENYGIELETLQTPQFLTTLFEGDELMPPAKRYMMAKFYEKQRRRLNVLVDERGNPVGGKWSFDEDNRRSMERGLDFTAPLVHKPNRHTVDAIEWAKSNFSHHYGQADSFNYPVTPAQAKAQLHFFLEYRFAKFGPHEDAVSKDERELYHSVLSAPINAGLITPREVIDAVIEFAAEKEVPINSLEGFVRQIIGWREFIRLCYERIGGKQRTRNFLKHHRKMPEAFWKGTTGIVPFDTTVRRLEKHAWSHHIERLMIAGNLMLLCEFDPDDVYRWFMEWYIDAYDWVMVPNVYGMVQFADGGLITTKPYVSSSNYIRKMSDYPKGDWCPIWDGLYWRFVDRHRELFRGNPRLSFTTSTLDKMDSAKRETHFRTAENWLNGLK